MEIKVFGPGCAKCTEAEKLVKEVVEAKGADITVRKVSDLREMMAAGILTTPAITIDNKIVCTGRVPSKAELIEWIDNAAAAPAPSGSNSSCCCCCGSR